MANETTTTSANDTHFAAWITSEILLEIRPMNVMRPFFRVAPAANSLTYDFPKQDDVAPTNVASLTEGTDHTTNVQMSTSKASVTAAALGIKAEITDLLKTVSLLNAVPHFSGVLARTMSEKLETDYAANLANFSNVTEATTTMTLDDHLKAIAALEQRDITSSLVSVYHPKQVGEIRSDLTSQTGTYWGAEKSGGADLVQYQTGGFVTTLFGVPIHQTSVVPTSDAAANRAGAMFAAGEALGLYELWGVRAEVDRDISKLADEVMLSTCFGTTEIDDIRGQTVKSDA